MSKIPAAVIGLGRIAGLLEDDRLREKPCTHTGAIAANPDCVLAAGCDIDEERRLLYSQKWQVPVYADAAEMIHVHKPQILVIATYPDSHYYYCRLAAACGVPLVICEKPLADTLGGARKIARLADEGMIIITNHERRYSADYMRAKKILAASALGRPLSIYAKLCMGKNRRLIDVLWHDGTHLIDAIMFLSTGTLKHKRRWGAPLSACTGTAWLEGEITGLPVNGIIAPPLPTLIEIGAERDHLIFEIEFSCERGRLRIGNGVFEIWESAPSPYAENFRSLKLSGETFDGPTGYFSNMLKDAVCCLREPGRQPQSGAADGLRVIEYLHSVKPSK
ncbi:MAG: Gfo/Idh/MocA family oxidoreductase [Treponema sp.]|nr:Gfo/Idh/MocA family oxidoreductase [Treponema sp.]